jgi:ATP-dependent helicase HrpA
MATTSLPDLPSIVYPDLPVAARRDEIVAALRSHRVLILCGETGSGKTTQIPKMCLEAGVAEGRMVGCTQPRRIAARSVANRIAEELKTEPGGLVGWKVRFTDRVREDTRIKIMTDGILLAETQGDPLLKRYATLVIDEAHERSLNIDFLLGYLRGLIKRRDDLRVVITSATLDAEKFSKHFGDAPVFEVSGRTYPVEVRYRPAGGPLPQPAPSAAPLPPGGRGWGEGKRGKAEEEPDIVAAILAATDELARLGQGDMLVFLPGEKEIRETAEALRKHHPPHTEILPLYSRLSVQDQDRVFKPSGARRIVLATNVAETSLTVPGIRYVIDTGTARVKRYSARNKVEQLLIEKISQASANQRAGRCGRVMAGVCVRLYEQNDFDARPRYTDPEIQRSSLAGVILRMASLKLGAVEDFPFIDPPHPRYVSDGYQLLTELNALDERGGLTAVGHELARLPLDPKTARMLIAARERGCVSEMLIIASALSVQDVRERPMERAQAADEKHGVFRDERSDFVGLVKLWHWIEEALKHRKSQRQFREHLEEHFVSPRKVREWREVHGQLADIAAELGLQKNEQPARYEDLHRALLAGLLGQIGFKSDDVKGRTVEGKYQGARGIRFNLHPASALAKKAPKWVVAAELTDTGRLLARVAAEIKPEWLEEVGAHLLERSYTEPHWDRDSARVLAFERVTLHGLAIVARRRVNFGPIDAPRAREIFIRAALAALDYKTDAAWLGHNQLLLAELAEEEQRLRRAHALIDEERIVAFFDARLPAEVHDGAGFEPWRREAERAKPACLHLSREDVVPAGSTEASVELFPKHLAVGEVECKLKYRFEPGHVMDGVTLIVPLYLLNQVNGAQLSWQVPGLRRDKVTALIRALPKDIRNRCQPLADWVSGFLTDLGPPQDDEASAALRPALAAWLGTRVKTPVNADDFRDALPPHLEMMVSVVDDKLAEIACGRDLAALRVQLGQQAQATYSQGEPGYEREGLTRWEVGDLPDKLDFKRQGKTLTGYPALRDDGHIGQIGESVSLRLLDTPDAAARAHRAGVMRLLRIALAAQLKQLDKHLPGIADMALKYRALGSPEQLRAELLDAVAERALLGEDPVPRREKDFHKQMERAKPRLPVVAQALARLVGEVLDAQHGLGAKIDAARAYPHAQRDLREQLARLVYPGFIRATPWERLQHLPRYLAACARRIEKLPGRVEHDKRHTDTLAQLWKRYAERLDKDRKAHIENEALADFRWQLEELRVSLFAQELKTPQPVSVKRLEKLWEGL